MMMMMQLTALSEYHAQQLVKCISTKQRRHFAHVGLVYFQKVTRCCLSQSVLSFLYNKWNKPHFIGAVLY